MGSITPESAALRRGFDYEDHLALYLMRHMLESGLTDFTVILEEKSSPTFDDIVVRIQRSTIHVQAKANDTGKLNSLKKSLKDKQEDVSLDERVLITHLNSDEISSELESSKFGYRGFRLTNDLCEKLKFATNYANCIVLVSPQESVIARENEEWFTRKHLDAGNSFYTAAIDEISRAFRTSDALARQFSFDRVLRTLRLEPHDNCHYVHSFSDLIDRPDQVHALTEASSESKLTFLLGEPGIGKSALLDIFCKNAEQTGHHRVIRHSCFTSPDDPLPRLNAKNVIEELYYSDESYRSSHRGALALPELIRKAHDSTKETVVIIDGVDHIQRDKPGELIEVGQTILALMAVEQVRLIVSAQVEDQLPSNVRGVSGSSSMQLHQLTKDEVKDITEHLGVNCPEDVIHLLQEKSSGIPLVLRYLLTQIRAGGLSGDSLLEYLNSMPTPKGVIDYLRRILSGLSPQDRLVIRLLCVLEFGFDRSTYESICGSVGLSMLQQQDLWHRINHIFRLIGPDRYLVWHYSLNTALDLFEKPPTSISQTLQTSIQGISVNVIDSVVYQALMQLQTTTPPLFEIAARVSSAALEAVINPRHAELLLIRICEKAAEDQDTQALIKTAFKLEPVFSIHRRDYHQSFSAEEAFAWANSSKRSVSLLFPGISDNLAEVLLRVKAGLKHALDSPELMWLVDRAYFKAPRGLGISMAFRYLHGESDIEELLNEISLSEWVSDEPAHPHQPDADILNRNSRIETAYLLGRALGLNESGAAIPEVSSTTRSTPLGSILFQFASLGALEVVGESNRDSIRKALVDHWLTDAKVSSRRAMYQAYISGNTAACKALQDKLAGQDFSKLASNIEFSTHRNDYLFSDHKLLFSIYLIGMRDAAIRGSIVSCLESRPSLGKKAILDILEVLLPCLESQNGNFNSYLTHVKATVPFRSVSRPWEYLNSARAGIKHLIEMGLIDLSQHDVQEFLQEIAKMKFGLDWIQLAQLQADSDGLKKRASKQLSEVESKYSTEPHTYQEQAANMACLFSVNGIQEEAEHLAETSYRLRFCNQYHKDITYTHMIDLVRLSRSYLDDEASRKVLYRVSRVLPILDLMTDGDHTHHWFYELTEVVYEKSDVYNSALVQYVSSMARGEGSVNSWWIGRLNDLLACQLKNTSDEHYASWIDLATLWFEREIPAGGDDWDKFRSNKLFKLWMIRGIRQQDYWHRGEAGRDIAEFMRKWCTGFLEHCKDDIAEGEHDFRSKPYFDDLVVACELLLGREPSYRVSREEEDHEPREPKLFSSAELAPGRINDILSNWYYWAGNWVAWGYEEKLQVAKAIAGMGKTGLAMTLHAFSDSLKEKYCSVFAAGYSLGLILGELGMTEELKVLIKAACDEFDDYFPNLPRSDEFGELMASLEFVT